MKTMCSIFVYCALALVLVGVVESLNYKDEIAQGACTSIIPDSKPAHIYAVRRHCTSGSRQTCEAVCSKLRKKCYNALHVYARIVHGSAETGKKGLHSYKYNSCTGSGCGPNYCCCSNNRHSGPKPLSYKEKIAQASCTAILPGKAHVFAVRRKCGSAKTCTKTCSNLQKKCLNSLHVYDAITIGNTDIGKMGFHSYRYNKCELAGCGPNFCCCT